MIKTPSISIIIPVYNSAKTLTGCLDSILSQDFKDIEVVIVDGQSEDSGLDIIREYSAKYPFIKWTSEKDKGAYDAMNKGIDHAKGKYLYFLGSDDSFYDHSVLSAVAEKIGQTGAKVVYGNVIIRGSNQYVSDGYIHAGEFDLKKILYQNISHQAIFYAREVFEQLGKFNIKYPVFADYDFNLRCFAKYEFRYLDMVIANFNVGGISTTVTDDAFEQDKGQNIIRYFYKDLFKSAFVNSRLFVQRAALSANTTLGFWSRLYCFMAYAKLKTQALFTS